MGSIIDLHVHTTVGSLDSEISPQRLVEQAQALGLSSVVLAEHHQSWPPEEVERLCQESGLLLINAREWSTNLGHIIVIGLDPDPRARNIIQVEDLRQMARAEGAYMIVAHPFRYFRGPSSYLSGSNRNPEPLPLERLARHPVFELVDTLEVLNGCSTERDNELAQAVAGHLGRQGTGGSDAHMVSELGRYATAFQHHIKSQEDLLEELKAGRFYPVQRTPEGTYVPP